MWVIIYESWQNIDKLTLSFFDRFFAIFIELLDFIGVGFCTTLERKLKTVTPEIISNKPQFWACDNRYHFWLLLQFRSQPKSFWAHSWYLKIWLFRVPILNIHFAKMRCVFLMVVAFILPLRNSDQMTIAKAHPTL